MPNSRQLRILHLAATSGIGNVAVERETGLDVERTDNIYSVPGWVREPVVDTPPPIGSTRPKWLLPAAIVILGIVTIGVVFGTYKIGARGQTIETRSVPFLGSALTRLTTTGKSKYVAMSPDGATLRTSSAASMARVSGCDR